jgi:outer membrane protein assembly factor BamE (lipoprotein component of BamABCDE complex)
MKNIMKIRQNILPSLFLIGILILFLTSCAGTPKKYLAIDASLVKQGQSKAEISEFFGPPNATRTNQTNQEEWYYYDVHRHFWQRIPFLGRHLGKEEVECLQIVLESGQVVKAVYYVQSIQS